jgi:xylulokinase
MTYLLGIDVGTTNIKTLVLDAESGTTLATAAQEYPISQPQPGYAEQNPEDWWQAAITTVRKALAEAKIDVNAVKGIGLSGQMHGTICLDKAQKPIRPAIIWADTRTVSQVEDIKARTTLEEMAQYAPGLPAAGFMGPTLMWLKQHEPETLEKTESVILPKDYVRLRLTGTVGTDVTDAAGAWLFDVASGQWSDWLLNLCGLSRDYMPSVTESVEVVGHLQPEAAEAMGLPAGIGVVAGCADQPAQALGYGLYNPDTALVTIGTGGQVFRSLNTPKADSQLRFYVVNHAVPNKWYALAAILSAGLCLRWLRDTLGLKDRPDAYDYLSQLAGGVPPGAEGLMFLPYLTGERTPLMDPLASGAFVGLRLHHTPGHLARAVMEGVAFATGECLSLVTHIEGSGDLKRVIISGGSAASPVWRQIQADVYNRPVMLSAGANHACVGAALIAGVGNGVYSSIEEACSHLPQPSQEITPNSKAAELYGERRGLFRDLYSHLKADMHALIDKN